MKTPIVVIGSHSFSGAHFVDYCLRQGHEVLGVSRSPMPPKPFLPFLWRNDEYAKHYRFHQLDLNHDLDRIAALVKQCRASCVVNFAAQSMVAQSWEHPEHWYQTNVVSTTALHERLRHFDFLERYVHISTPEVYGNCEGFVAEHRNYHPSTPYAISRAAADMSLHAYHQAYGFPVVFTRAANVFGPGQQLYRIVPRVALFLRMGKAIPLHGGGVSERSFIHIEDVSNATYRIMNEGESGEIYHISTQRTVSIRDLVAMICERMGKSFDDSVEIVGERLGKDAAYLLDSGKLRALGWQDRYGLERGIDQVIEWVDDYFDELSRYPHDYVHKP